MVAANNNTFKVPPGMLANLPTTITASGDASGALLFVTVPAGSQFVIFNTSSALPLDRGVAMYLTGEAHQVVFE